MNGTTENLFQGQIPIFSPRKSAFFSSVLINQLRFIFRQKKVGVACQKMGIGPQKCLWNTNLLIKITKKTFFWPDSIKERFLESQNHFLQILSDVMLTKIVFFCILEVFFGSKTYYLMGDTHFFFSENILQSIYHIP